MEASTISARGQELASKSLRKKFATILGNLYHPEKNPRGIVNIGVSENFAMVPEVIKFANKHFQVAISDLTYGEGPWGSARLRKAMANHMHRNFPTLTPLDHDDLLFANGITPLCEMLGFSIFEPGDGILLPRPIYQAFQSDFGLKAKVESIFVTFGDVDQFSPEAIPKYEHALLESQKSGIRIRALMLCNPHNPLGRCYTKDTIISLMKFCQEHKIHLLSDEVYALSVYEVPNDPNAVNFTSALSFDTSPYISDAYLHVIYGMSKDEAVGGLRLGCLYTKNAELMEAMAGITQFHWAGGASQVIATSMLEDQEWMSDFLKLSRERLAAKNKLARDILDTNGIKYYLDANAGFFLWISLSPYLPAARRGVDAKDNWEGEGMLMKQLLENGVYITKGEELKSEEAGWFRIIFSQDEEVLREGLTRVIKAMNEVRGTALPPLEDLKLEGI